MNSECSESCHASDRQVKNVFSYLQSLCFQTGGHLVLCRIKVVALGRWGKFSSFTKKNKKRKSTKLEIQKQQRKFSSTKCSDLKIGSASFIIIHCFKNWVCSLIKCIPNSRGTHTYIYTHTPHRHTQRL